MATTLDEVMELAQREQYLAVVATVRADLTDPGLAGQRRWHAPSGHR